jgi:NADH-quinone oxidoreductase subunit A
MLFFFYSYKILIYITFSIFLAVIIIFLSFRLSLNNPDSEKLSSYECGFDPYEDARNVFDVRFYLIAILFLLFDLEAAYFFPWSISISFLTLDGFYAMIDFLFELVIGYIYAYKSQALNWDQNTLLIYGI